MDLQFLNEVSGLNMSGLPHQRPTVPLDISLGVEFEFMILKPHEPRRTTGCETIDMFFYVLPLVAKALKGPIELKCSSCGETHTLLLPIWVQQDMDQCPASNQECWNVACDWSTKLSELQVSALQSNDYEAYGIELTSRVLFADHPIVTTGGENDVKHKHTVTYQDEITGVFNTLHQAFSSDTTAHDLYSRYRWLTNKSCGLHVQVGNGSAGFPFQTVKNVLSIYTTFERLIDSMHNTTRIAGSRLAVTPLDAVYNEFLGGHTETDDMAEETIFPDIYNKSLAGHLISSAYMARRNDIIPQAMSAHEYYPANHVDNNEPLKQAASGFHMRDPVEVIQQAPDLKSLQELLSNHRRLHVSIQHLVTRPEQFVSPAEKNARYNTIEFRQHAGITDARDALPWIDFMRTLVRYAHSQSADSVRATCNLAGSDPRLSLADLFQIIRIEKQTRDHYLGRSEETFQKAVNDYRAKVDRELPNGYLKTVTLQLLDECAEAQNPEAIEKTIRKKFKEGGYGQFGRDFIDVYAPDLSEKDKEKLTIGWDATPGWFKRFR